MSTEQIPLFDDPNPGEYAFTEQAHRSRCASCGKPVVWITTSNGKTMPLSLVTQREINGATYAMTHFADCKHSREWSRNKR